MLDQVLDLFGIKPDINLKIMQKSQTLSNIASEIIQNLDSHLNDQDNSIVFVMAIHQQPFMLLYQHFIIRSL